MMAKENRILDTGGPSQTQALSTSRLIEALGQDLIESEAMQLKRRPYL